MLIAAVVAIQTSLIIGLFYERRNRRGAEAISRSAMAMSASIAHEINQPLAAIVTNANAGLRWLANKTPDLDEARAAFKRVATDGHRAGEVIESVRMMFKKESGEISSVDLNELIQNVLRLLRGELQRQGIVVQTDLTRPFPLVLGHSGQLQQVILNLVKNGAEAMDTVSGRERALRVKSTIHESDGVLVSLKTPELASIPRTSTTSLIRSSLQNRKGWVWGYPSVGRSSKPIMVGFGPHPALIMARFLPFNCRAFRPGVQ